jgi:hypothetical protein
MARRKKFHKIKIHPNRYLIWSAAITFIVAAALVSYIQVSGISLDAQLSYSDTAYWHTYKDANISIRYPAEWVIDPGTNSVGFGNKTEDLFLVYTYSPPDDAAYDAYAKLPTSKHINVDGVMGFRVQDTKNSSQRIAFVKTSKRLYEFRGSSLYFDKILETVKLLKK